MRIEPAHTVHPRTKYGGSTHIVLWLFTHHTVETLGMLVHGVHTGRHVSAVAAGEEAGNVIVQAQWDLALVTRER
jgi:hypothetical protein